MKRSLFQLATLISTSLLSVNPAANSEEEKEKARPGELKPSVGIKVDAAFREGDFEEVIKLTGDLEEDSALLRYRAEALHRRGVEHYFAARIKESIADFDQCIGIEPARDPYHWQRGISYYHADEFEKGKAQFERHQTVNSQDVENAVFHFICAVRAPGGSVEEAQKNFINIEADSRVPMKEIHALYAGTGTAEAVVEAAEKGDAAPEKLRNHLCYAHLYLGLYFEALGEAEKSADHMKLAAGKYRMDHYMGKVAQVHAKLRSLEIESKPAE